MSIYAIPSTTFQAVVNGVPTGLTGTLGVRLLNLGVTPPSTTIARQTSGITENPSGSGVYVVSLTAPATIGEYLVVWDTGTTTPSTTASEELFVTGTPPTPTTTGTGEQGGMSLASLCAEVLNHGFDGTIFTSTRLNQYLNDALGELSARVQYYGEEQEQQSATISGSAKYLFPTGTTKIRSVYLTETHQELGLIDLRDMDRSGTTSGTPYAYALDGNGIRVFPTPDAQYGMNIRYWKVLTPLSYDTDTPTIPARYHRSLCDYAIARCFESEDDIQQAQYYEARWQQTIKNFKSDLVFPLTDGPRQVRSQWDSGPVKPGWGFWL